MKRKFLQFMSPDGGEGGGAAVAEPPAKQEQNRFGDGSNVSEGLVSSAGLWKEALAKAEAEARGESSDEGKAGKEPKADESKGGEGDKTKEPAKTSDEPGDALGTQFDGTAPTKADERQEGVDEETAALLKELPETLPREGRGAHWEKSRAGHERQGKTIFKLQSELTRATKELEAAKSVPPDALKQVIELQAEVDKWKDLAVAANIDLDPAIREKYVTGRANKVSRAVSKLNAYGGDGAALAKALELPEGRMRNQAIKEALGELEDVERTRIMTFVSEVEQLDDELSEIKKNPQPEWERLQKAEKAKLQKKQEEAEQFKKSTFDSVYAKMPEELFLLRKVPENVKGHVEANALIDSIKDQAFKLLSPETKPDELVKAALWGKAGPTLQKMVVDLRGQLRTALSTIKDYEGARPGFRGDGKKESAKTDADMSAGEIFLREMAKAREGE